MTARRLTRGQCAELAGITPSTWSAYVARSQAPAPVEHMSRTPLWDAAQVKAWAEARPGQGARTDLRRRGMGEGALYQDALAHPHANLGECRTCHQWGDWALSTDEGDTEVGYQCRKCGHVTVVTASQLARAIAYRTATDLAREHRITPTRCRACGTTVARGLDWSPPTPGVPDDYAQWECTVCGRYQTMTRGQIQRRICQEAAGTW